jgi:hypothetical protein
MLQREESQKILKQEQTANWEKLSLSVIQNELPARLRSAAYALLNRDEQGNAALSSPVGYDQDAVARYQEQLERHQESVERGLVALGALDSLNRVAIFALFAPQIARTLEAAWQLLGHLPYQNSYYWMRKAFRAPGNDTIAYTRRVSWLQNILSVLAIYRNKDLAWFATWASYLDNHSIGILFAAAIDEGGVEGEAVFDILVASANGTHPIGGMCQSVITGLLAASRPEGWSCIERLLLAAQREEGLRQVILETIDESHPQAFRRMLHLILEHDLIRFSATIRAVDVWFGFGWTVDNTRAVRDALNTILIYLDDLAVRQEAILHGNPQDLYFALWAMAFENVLSAITDAAPALAAALPERRLAAAHLLGQLGLTEAQPVLLPLLDDPDLRVAFSAFSSLSGAASTLASTDLFEHLEQLLGRVGRSDKTLESNIWPWLGIRASSREIISALIQCLGERLPERLIVYLPLMDSWSRISVAEKLADQPVWNEEVRRVLYDLLGDRSHWIRERALALIACRPLDEAGVQIIEQLLTRKSSDLRRGLIELLLKREDQAVLDSTRRLLAASQLLQRQAGLDLLHGLVKDGRAVEESRRVARSYQEGRETLSFDEVTLIDTILTTGDVAEAPTLANVFGLVSPQDFTPRVSPRHFTVNMNMTAARNCLLALDALIAEHRTTPILVKTWQGTEEMLLGNVGWQFPAPNSSADSETEAEATFPLLELWRKWERERPAGLRDEDGLELWRAHILLNTTHVAYPASAAVEDNAVESTEDPSDNLSEHDLVPEVELERLPLAYYGTVHHILDWLVRLQETSNNALMFLFDAVEDALASLSLEDLERELASEQKKETIYRSVRHDVQNATFNLLSQYHTWYSAFWTPEQHIRYWQLLHWLDQPLPGLSRFRPSLEIVLAAYRAGGATRADLLDQLTGSDARIYYSRGGDLHQLSGRKPHALVQEYPVLVSLVASLRERILEIELARGEMPTVATQLAFSLHYSGGLSVFVRLVASLNPTDLARGYVYDNESRGAIFSHLLRITYPDPNIPFEEFRQQAEIARLRVENLVAAALYAPQWASYVERYLEWAHFEEAVWWIYAHTKDSGWSIDEELREEWRARVAERTPLSAEDLLAGAVDVAWFWRSYRGLGEERWEQVYTAAKYAASGSGHGRARLFADAMTNRASVEELRQRMFARRSQDAVRALGLVPLPVDSAARDAEMSERYVAFQEFKRGSRKFGAQRRGNEEIAVGIGLENLARTAGYPDPLRLQWAMEASTAADLRDGELAIEEGNVRVTLALSTGMVPTQLRIVKSDGKTLKALPAKLKKLPAVVSLLARKREVEQQVVRMRISLEQAMCRGDEFTARELVELLAHPVLSPILQNLVFVHAGDGPDAKNRVLGYPLCDSMGMLHFRDYDGAVTVPDASCAAFRLAHPYDLFKSEAWHTWQHECFAASRIQPFKQIFRELYLCTRNEMGNGDGTISRRYSGHQVQPKQARALLGQRNWVGDYYEDGMHRVFHDQGITASVTFSNAMFTPLEVGHLIIENVHFYQKSKMLPLVSVPPRLFSEVMRDLDLVVSVAHSGGVDPEVTLSTIEMRAMLAGETCMLLGLTNVVLQSAHALIEGTLGSYSVHLGSAVVHRQPGGALCIVPVHEQQRGRLFLPFASDDPKSAEVITKIITLARDQDIKDPTILEQLR